MDVATQLSQIPASKIIYITPKSTREVDVLQENLKTTHRVTNVIEVTQNGQNKPNTGVGGGNVQNVNVTTQRPNQPTLHGQIVNVNGEKLYAQTSTSTASCIGQSQGTIPNKPAAATQTVLIPATGSTILDEMKKKAGETFRKLNIYQSNMAAPEPEKKSVLLPGTDSEYRTPGAHYRNKNGQIKRPMNAFMVWAREFRGKLAAAMPNATNSDISIKLGQVWSSLPPEQKRQYYNIAEKIKLKHRQDFPDWVYKPVPTFKKKDCAPAENSGQVREIMTSSMQPNILPNFPLVNLPPDVNNNQSGITTSTRIPVILQPVTYHCGPSTDQRTIKEKLVEKIYGTAQNIPQITTRPINPVQNVTVPPRELETMNVQPHVTEQPSVASRVVSGQTDHPKLGKLLRNAELLKVPLTTSKPAQSPVPATSHTSSTTPRVTTPNVTKTPLVEKTVPPVYTTKPSEPQSRDPRDQSRGHQNQREDIMRPVSGQGRPTSQSAEVPVGTEKSYSNISLPYFTQDLLENEYFEGSEISDHKPMYLELLDPFDPLMDCDFLYSELYPGCLHLDVARWREYLDISSDDENDPLSLFQDDSDDDIKISPVPLKESLRRMCNANVQKSASGEVITCDILVPVPVDNSEDKSKDSDKNTDKTSKGSGDDASKPIKTT